MFKQRLSRVTRHMQVQGLEQIVISAPASVYYLTGHWVEPHERMLALYLTAAGEATLFANEIFGLQSAPELPVVAHTDSGDPVHALARAVRPGKLGIDKFYYSKFLIGLMQARGDILPVHGSAPVDLARMLKDETERRLLRESSRANDRVMAAVIGMLRAGVAENELAAEVNRLYLRNGADCEGAQLVCFGANGADPHHAAGSARLQQGDSVTFDIFIPINRYWCDMTRTVFYKSVTKKQREVYELVRRANEAAIARIRPGVKLCEIDAAARDVIVRGGYGAQFTHRLGHGIGLDCHEPPDVSAASDTSVQAGMAFSVEPGIYLPGEFGVRIEDLVLVTDDGCEVLNAAPKDLIVVG